MKNAKGPDAQELVRSAQSHLDQAVEAILLAEMETGLQIDRLRLFEWSKRGCVLLDEWERQARHRKKRQKKSGK